MMKGKLLIILIGVIIMTINLISASICPSGVGYCNPKLPFLNPSATGAITSGNTTNFTNYWQVGTNQNVDGGLKSGTFSLSSSGSANFSFLKAGSPSAIGQLDVFSDENGFGNPNNDKGGFIKDKTSQRALWLASWGLEGLNIDNLGVWDGTYAPVYINYYSNQVTHIGQGNGGLYVGQALTTPPTMGNDELYVNGNITAHNICYSNGTGCQPSGVNYTNIAMTNTSNTFNQSQIINGNLSVTQNMTALRVISSLYDNGSIAYTTQYPISVGATTNYSTSYLPNFSVDPSKSLTGTHANNQWLAGGSCPPCTNSTNQSFHFDLGSAKIITRIYYENSHNSGATDIGARNFTFWGSNTAGDFNDVVYANDGTWTQLTVNKLSLDQHRPFDTPDPKYVYVTNNVAYRYYRLKFANNWGNSYYLGIRRVELQTNITGTPVLFIDHNTRKFYGINGNNSLMMDLSEIGYVRYGNNLIVAPHFVGGENANDDLTLEGTNSITRTTSNVNIQPNGGYVGIGTLTSDQPMCISSSRLSATGMTLGSTAGIKVSIVEQNLVGSNTGYGWHFGSAGTGVAWVQSGSTASATAYGMSLQANGGGVTIGSINVPLARQTLDVYGNVTIRGDLNVTRNIAVSGNINQALGTLSNLYNTTINTKARLTSTLQDQAILTFDVGNPSLAWGFGYTNTADTTAELYNHYTGANSQIVFGFGTNYAVNRALIIKQNLTQVNGNLNVIGNATIRGDLNVTGLTVGNTGITLGSVSGTYGRRIFTDGTYFGLGIGSGSSLYMFNSAGTSKFQFSGLGKLTMTGTSGAGEGGIDLTAGGSNAMITVSQTGGKFLALQAGASGATYGFDKTGNFYIHAGDSIADASVDPSHSLTFTGNATNYSRLGINTLTPSYPLEVAGNESGTAVTIYSHGNVSATGYITRTSVYDKSKGKALDNIHDSNYYLTDGKIDHSKFEIGRVSYDIKITSKDSNDINNVNAKEISYIKHEEGVLLDDRIALLEQAIYELKTENNLIKSELCKKDNSYMFCA